MRKNGIYAAVMVVGLLLLGCGGSGDGGDADFDEYTGIIAGSGGTSGTLEISVPTGMPAARAQNATGDPVTVSGTLTLASGAVPLTGTYDPVSGAFTVSGGGYTFTGNLASGAITGIFTGPMGEMGNFTAHSGDNARAFCGTFAGDATGIWNMVLSSSGGGGTYACAGGSGNDCSGGLTCTVSGNTVNCTGDSTCEATISGDSLSGTWNGGDATGTFSGSTGDCP